jgi:hypothetical protein
MKIRFRLAVAFLYWPVNFLSVNPKTNTIAFKFSVIHVRRQKEVFNKRSLSAITDDIFLYSCSQSFMSRSSK